MISFEIRYPTKNESKKFVSCFVNHSLGGALSLSIMTFSTMTLNITIYIIMTLSIMTLNITIFFIMTLRIRH